MSRAGAQGRIDAVDRIPRTEVQVVGQTMSVAAAGRGSPTVVFVHGNGTYSYVWRNLIAAMAGRYRCLAPDLPGMGRSDVTFPSGDASYEFGDQATRLEILLELVEPANPVVMVGHELGAAIALQHARNNPDQVVGVVLIEGVFRVSNDTTFEPDIQSLLADLRSDAGESLVLQHNAVIERYLPRLTQRPLGPDEMDAYRSPYPYAGESRRALLSLLRQLPLRSHPGPIDELSEELRKWSAGSPVPKLVIGGKPGYLVPPAVLGTAARWTNTSTVAVPGVHYLMEDSPDQIAAEILAWIDATVGGGAKPA